LQTVGDQLLDQLGAGGLVLDQHDTGAQPLVLLAHRALQLGYSMRRRKTSIR